MLNALRRAVRGIGAAVRARPGVFASVAAGVFLLHVFLPPLVLSVTRKPVDYFTFNPWLSRLPAYLVSTEATLSRKLGFLPNLALFWFSADSPFGVEWGFTVNVSDLARFAVMSLLVGVFFALWVYPRSPGGRGGGGGAAAGRGGVTGALASVFGLSTGPCSVMGCGAPVIPVAGLAFTGLSSGTLTMLAGVSRVATAVVLGLMAAGIVYYGWLVAPRSTPADS